MANREVLRLEIAEVVRRWQAGNSQRNMASGTGLSRDTVRNYLAAAKLTASDGADEDQFGISVAVDGATVVVGAFYDDDNGRSSGSA